MIRNLSTGKQPTFFFGKQPISTAGKQPTIPVYCPKITKKLNKRWNQSDLNHFDPHLNEVAYGKNKVITLMKDIYYQNMVLFIQ